MISKILINVDDIEYISDYRKAGVTAFLFPLTDYCVGYSNTYTLDEINNCGVSNKYILVNRVLDCAAVDGIKEILSNDLNITGIVYEDIAIYNIVKDMELDIELIHFQNHFATNSFSVNFWLDRVNSVMLGNEITENEIDCIISNAKNKVCLHVFGYNQVMYSRRLLLTNWSDEFNISYKNINVLEEKVTKIKFRAVENEYGTVMYSENIFNGLHMLDKDIKYGYINTTMIDHDTIMNVLNDLKYDGLGDDGFLNKETIYKLKGRE